MVGDEWLKFTTYIFKVTIFRRISLNILRSLFLKEDSPYVIEFKDVVKEYPGIRALKGISFSVRRGRVHGFLGPNGAGKSTAMNILAGLIPPSQGDVFVFGKSVKSHPLEARESIGFLPESPPLYDSMRVRDYLEFVANIHSIRTKRIVKLSAQVNSVIEKCGLEKVETRLVGNLSKGYRQRVGIAQAIVFDPSLIIFDEPTNGLDPDAIVEIRRLIQELGRERTVLLSSHILPEVELMCDDITIIRDGEISRTGTLSEIQQSFQKGKVIKAEVEKWNDELQSELAKHFGAQRIETSQNERSISLSVHLSGDDQSREDRAQDLRSQVSRFLVEKDCGLLFFEEDRPHLEDIFHFTTQKEERN